MERARLRDVSETEMCLLMPTGREVVGVLAVPRKDISSIPVERCDILKLEFAPKRASKLDY